MVSSSIDNYSYSCLYNSPNALTITGIAELRSNKIMLFRIICNKASTIIEQQLSCTAQLINYPHTALVSGFMIENTLCIITAQNLIFSQV